MRTTVAMGFLMLIACACGPADDDTSAAPGTAADASTGVSRPDSLHAMRQLGRLTDTEGGEWLLVAGVECTGCDAPESVYLTRAGSSELTAGPYEGAGEFAEMGVDEAPHARVRILFGDCLTTPGDEAVWLIERDQGGAAWTRTAFVVRPGAPPADSPIAWDEELNTQLTLATECDEVPPRPQYVPRPEPAE